MNREVNLTKRVQTPHGWRYCAVVLSANGRVKPDLVIVNGKQEVHAEGSYYLEWRDGTKRVRLSVGKNPADATARRLRKEAELNAVNNGVSVIPDSQNKHRSLADHAGSRLATTQSQCCPSLANGCALMLASASYQTSRIFEYSRTASFNKNLFAAVMAVDKTVWTKLRYKSIAAGFSISFFIRPQEGCSGSSVEYTMIYRKRQNCCGRQTEGAGRSP